MNLPVGEIVTVTSKKHPGAHFVLLKGMHGRKDRFICKVYEGDHAEEIARIIRNALREHQQAPTFER